MNPTWKVFFVDDEPAVLDGLKNLLRRERHRWAMSFFPSAAAALERMEQEAPDVVISDMRMPVMDGAQFLAEVKTRFPGAARVVLSGHAEREAVVRALPVAHQYLSKPCEAELLRSTVERICALHQVLDEPGVRQLIGRVSVLPAAPRLYSELSALTSRPDTGLNEVAALIERDPAMSAKVLQLANSAFFGPAQRVSSVKRAASYLGLELLKSLVLSAEVFGAFAERLRALVDEVQQDAMRVAQLTGKMLAGTAALEDGLAAALLHDVGKLVVAASAPEKTAQLLAHPRRGSVPLVELEREIYGTTHAEIGAYLLGVWGLPFTVVEAVAHHHSPSKVGPGPRELLAALHAAAALAGDGEPLDLAFLGEAGVLDALPQWRQWADQANAAGSANAAGPARLTH